MGKLQDAQIAGAQVDDIRGMCMSSPFYPTLYQVNVRVWLRLLAASRRRSVTLDDIPDAALDQWQRQGFDWIYLLGVWQTGTIAPQISRTNPTWVSAYHELLSDLTAADVCGSCFAIAGYTAHTELGGDAALRRFRDRLHQRGLKLMLDFVPNHTAPDHPWVTAHPDFYMQGTAEQLAAAPENYGRFGDRIFAYGRDPYFPGWCDTLQLNYANPHLQTVQRAELLRIAQWCDGLRCDMAMLVESDIFCRTWDLSRIPAFWPEAIAQVRAHHPDFVFMAEVYWGLEWAMQQQGFDYTYDKSLYDRLRLGQARAVREHFWAALDYQAKSVRFLENHDEPRAAAVFDFDRHRAAAIITFLCPGLRFFHQGQFEGYPFHISIHLNRGPVVAENPDVQRFYQVLLQCLRSPLFKTGNGQLATCTPAWQDNPTADQFIAWYWWDDSRGHGEGARGLAIVNYAPHAGQCYLQLPEPIPVFSGLYRLCDYFTGVEYDRPGELFFGQGVYFDLPAWGYHVFAVTAIA